MSTPFHYISEILAGYWMIDEQWALSNQPLIDAFLKGRQSDFISRNETDYEPVMATVGVGPAKTNTKTIGIVPVLGPLTKSDAPCGGPKGYETIANNIIKMAEDNTVHGIVLKTDSPGGNVYGINTVEKAIDYARSIKPVTSYVSDGSMASAAYKIGSRAQEVYASHKMDMVGSIGTMISLQRDVEGIQYIYADQSSEKNADFHAALDGKPDGIKKNMLNPLAQDFIDTVKINRAAKLKEDGPDPFKGRTFFAEQGQKIGLIDGIKSFEEVVRRTAELSDNYVSNNNQHMALFGKDKYPKLSALSGKEAKDIQDADVDAANDELKAAGITAVLLISEEDAATAQTLASQAEQHAADKSKAEGELAAAKKSIAALTKERDDWKQKAEEYGAQPGAMHTTHNREKDDIEGGKNKFFDPDAEHNKAMAEAGF